MHGKSIAILESRLGTHFADLIVKRGGRPFHAPALAEIPEVDPGNIARLISALEIHPAKVAVFQTGVGTHALFNATDALGLTPRLVALLTPMTVVVRGPKPTAALRSRNVRIDLGAKQPYTTVEVLQALEGIELDGERVIVQRYGAANVELEKALGEKGARVIDIPLYRWSLPANTQPLVALMDALGRGDIDAAAFTNASQVDNLFALAAELGRAAEMRANLNRVLIASIGPVCTAALTKHGVTIGLESDPPKLGALMSALEKALSGQSAKRLRNQVVSGGSNRNQSARRHGRPCAETGLSSSAHRSSCSHE